MKEKEVSFYMEVARAASKMSYAQRKKVGAVVVTENGGMYYGYNGTPAGFDNCCEIEVNDGAGFYLTTKDIVIHAEKNCFSKMLKEGVSTHGGKLFVTMSPCVQCALMIISAGITHVYYDEQYRCDSGVVLLKQAGVIVVGINNEN